MGRRLFERSSWSALVVAASIVLLPGAAAAQGDAAVISYPPSFFAEFRPNSAMGMVNRLPGFSFDGGASDRGYAGNAGNVLIDGQRPPTQSDSLSSVLDRIAASSVERIDLVRGGAGGIDMHGKTLIANVILKKQASTTGSWSANVGRDGYGDIDPSFGYQIQRRKNDRSLEASANYFRYGATGAGELIQVDPLGAVLKQNTNTGDGYGDGGNLTGAYEAPLAGGKLRINGRVSTDSFRSVQDSILIVPGGVEVSTNRNRNSRAEAGARFNRPLPHGLDMEIVALLSASDNPYRNSYDTPAFTSASRGKTIGKGAVVSSTFTLRPRGKWSGEAGAEVAYNRQDAESAYSFNGGAFPLSGDVSVVDELRNEAFITATWRPTSSLSIQAGTRYELSTISASGTAGGGEQTLNYLKPRLNISWSPNKANQFSLRAERQVDQLSFGGFAASASFATGIFGVGNPDLRPATNWIYEGRYELRFWDRGSIVVSAQHWDIDDVNLRVLVSAPDPLGGPPILYDIVRNTGTATRDELSLRTSVPLDRVGIKGGTFGSYTLWRKTAVEDPITHVARVLNIKPFEWSVSLGQQIQNSKYSWSIFANGREASINYAPRSITTYRDPPHYSLSFGYRPKPGIDLSLSLNNLTAPDFDNFYTSYTAPRNVGVPAYTETSRSYGVRSVQFNLRRSF